MGISKTNRGIFLLTTFRNRTLRCILWFRKSALVKISHCNHTSRINFHLNPIGFTSGELSAMFLGLESSILEPSRNDLIGGSFIMALFAVPLIALASNLIITIRGDDSFHRKLTKIPGWRK